MTTYPSIYPSSFHHYPKNYRSIHPQIEIVRKFKKRETTFPRFSIPNWRPTIVIERHDEPQSQWKRVTNKKKKKRKRVSHISPVNCPEIFRPGGVRNNQNAGTKGALNDRTFRDHTRIIQETESEDRKRWHEWHASRVRGNPMGPVS